MERFENKITVKELCNVLEFPCSVFYRWLQRIEGLRDNIEEKIKDGCLRNKLCMVWISKGDRSTSKNGAVCES